jgi:hypothetical protein
MKILKLLKGLILGYDFKCIDELAKYYFREPAKLAWWIERKIWPKQDTDPYTWPYTKQVLKDQWADCKGFSLIPYECLIVWGYNPILVGIFGKRDGHWKAHAICVYEENGHLNYFDNGAFVSLSYNDMARLAGRIAGELKYTDWYYKVENYDTLKRDI